MIAQAEKRKDQPRIAAYMPARIIVPGKVSEAGCIVRQISPAGAQLDIDPGWILPQSFWLRLVGDTRMHVCSVVWREGEHVGVEFRADQRSSWWNRHQQPAKQLPTRDRLGVQARC